MSDPSYLLQVAIVAALKADAALVAFVADRVFDEVPEDAQFPYIKVGDDHVLEDDTEDCADGSEVFVNTHVWSREVGRVEAKKIAAEVRRVLKTVTTLVGFTVTVSQFVDRQVFDDPDGISKHAVVSHRYLITHTS